MLNKVFSNLVDVKLRNMIEEPIMQKATVKTFENGNRLIDMRIVEAEHAKIGTFIWCGGIAATIIGIILGDISSR